LIASTGAIWAKQIQEFSTMAIKVVTLIQLQTTPPRYTAPELNYTARSHIAGFSEVLWWFDDNVSNLQQALQKGINGQVGLLPARAQLLPTSGTIVGVRLYSGGAGRGQSLAYSYPGTANYNTDIPQMALLVKAGNAGSTATRRFTIRAIPDLFVEYGEFSPSDTYKQRLTDYFGALGNFVFNALNPANAKVKAFTIAPVAFAGPPARTDGQVTLVQNAVPFQPNTVVRISRALDANGIARSGDFTISQIGPIQGQFNVMYWPYGFCTGGTVSARAYGLYGISPSLCAVERVVVRKVGRPFEQYRGRRSKRRPEVAA
jgi:hypothetical protein